MAVLALERLPPQYLSIIPREFKIGGSIHFCENWQRHSARFQFAWQPIDNYPSGRCIAFPGLHKVYPRVVSYCLAARTHERYAGNIRGRIISMRKFLQNRLQGEQHGLATISALKPANDHSAENYIPLGGQCCRGPDVIRTGDVTIPPAGGKCDGWASYRELLRAHQARHHRDIPQRQPRIPAPLSVAIRFRLERA